MKLLKQLVDSEYQALSGHFELMQNISEINKLIKLISKLPGLGPKSAKRIILKLINNRQELMMPLAQTLSETYKNSLFLSTCHEFFLYFHDTRVEEFIYISCYF